MTTTNSELTQQEGSGKKKRQTLCDKLKAWQLLFCLKKNCPPNSTFLLNRSFSERRENMILSEDHNNTHKQYLTVLFCTHKCFAILLFLPSCVVQTKLLMYMLTSWITQKISILPRQLVVTHVISMKRNKQQGSKSTSLQPLDVTF